MRYCFSRSLAARQLTRRRLALALLVALFVFGLSWVSSAWADAPVTMYRARLQASPFTYGSWATTKQGACDGLASGWHVGVPPTYNDAMCFDSANYAKADIATSPGAVCSPGGTAPDTTKPLDQQCAKDCTAPSVKNLYLGASVQGTATSLPSTICIQGCSYAAGGVGVQVGASYATDIGVGTGGNCTGANYDVIDTTTKKTDPPSLVSCQKQGKVYGTVNGVGICAAAGTIPNSTVQQQSTSTSQATSASGVQAASQTTGESTTVSNVNGVPTVIRTVTNPDGSKSTTTQDQPSFCAQNPNAQVCKESNSNVSGGGDCSAAPVCQGDAVQCAMVNQQWHTRCDSNQANAQSDLGAQILAGNDPVKNPASVGERTVQNISSSIDQSAFLGGSGLSDKIVTVSGQAITLPFSRLNQYLVWLGHIFVVISLIGGLRIVLGGFK